MIPRPVHVITPDGVGIYYETFGTGPTRLVYLTRLGQSIGYIWEIPLYARFLSRLGAVAEVMVLDVRGIGFADRILPEDRSLALEARVTDVVAAMDDAGWSSAFVLGVEDGGSLGALLAATHPDRVDGLMLYGTTARSTTSEDYPYGWPREAWDTFIEDVMKARHTWEWALTQMEVLAPSHLGDEELARRMVTLYLMGGSTVALWEIQRDIDIRGVLGSIQAPTLVIDRRDSEVATVEEGDYLAERIPGARRVVIEGRDFEVFAGDQDALLQQFIEFMGGGQKHEPSSRVLTTVLFTDIVDSTRQVLELGDVAWARRVAEHHEAVRQVLTDFGGREVDTAGDGFFATFDGPARAAQAALRIAAAVHQATGLDVRAGVHTGEVELMDGQVRGVAVHVGARVCALARPRQVLATGIVRDLTAGSGLAFDDQGLHELKGFDEPVRLFEVG
jgi:class 3 adenylate cyclase